MRHERRIPVLDQGNLGSCTGNAGIGALGTDPLYDSLDAGVAGKLQGLVGHYSLNEAGAVQLYSDATKIDDAPGQYPPTDTGSDGLAIAKVLKSAGEISGYQHTFSLHDALLALGQSPLMVGTVWLQSMFTPSAEGILQVDQASPVAGGHEYVVDEYDAVRGLVGMTNSWGTSWGLAGRAYIAVDDLGWLLDQQGDVIVLLPLTQPAPTPSPAPDVTPAAQALAAALRHDDWVHHSHIGGNARVAHAALPWLAEEGL